MSNPPHLLSKPKVHPSRLSAVLVQQMPRDQLRNKKMLWKRQKKPIWLLTGEEDSAEYRKRKMEQAKLRPRSLSQIELPSKSGGATPRSRGNTTSAFESAQMEEMEGGTPLRRSHTTSEAVEQRREETDQSEQLQNTGIQEEKKIDSDKAPSVRKEESTTTSMERMPGLDESLVSDGEGKRGQESHGGGSAPRRDTRRSSAAMEDKEQSTFQLQEQIRKFMARRDKVIKERKEVEAYQRLLREAIDKLNESRGKMGGYHAVQENEAVMERNLEILEKRVAKANVDLMEERTNNEHLRRAVDERRKQKNAKEEAIQKLEVENENIKSKIKKYEQDIDEYDRTRERVEEDIDVALNETKSRLAELENEYEVLEDTINKSKFQMDLPVPKVSGQDSSVYEDESHAVTKEEAESVISKHGFGSPLKACKSPERSKDKSKDRWPNIHEALQSIDKSEDPTLTLKQIWEQVSWVTGIESPEEFSNRFMEGNELNYNLFRRLDGLKKESEELRSRIQQYRNEIEQREHELRVTDTERKGVFESMQKQINQAKQKKKRQAQEIEILQQAQKELGDGVKRLLETLDANVPVSHATEGSDCRRLYSMFEYRLKQVLSAYARFTGQLPSGRRKSTEEQSVSQTLPKHSSAAQSMDATKPLSNVERRQYIDLSIMDIRKGMLAAAADEYVGVQTPRSEQEEPQEEAAEEEAGRSSPTRQGKSHQLHVQTSSSSQRDHLLQPANFVVGPDSPVRSRPTSTPKPRTEVPSPKNMRTLEQAEFSAAKNDKL
eukprot:gb/GECG01005008.1/.p1 GENE.gb/GECG01005008.1/~~gb/GECG01005008.1/.p1  ORF type:complete len:776 (+),score=147.62 gb/GECG01005008.1/:1-2328(+)